MLFRKRICHSQWVVDTVFSVALHDIVPTCTILCSREGFERVVAFSQYPQYSCCTTGSNLNAMYRFCSKQQLLSKAKWIFIDRWPIHDAITQVSGNVEEIKTPALAKTCMMCLLVHLAIICYSLLK